MSARSQFLDRHGEDRRLTFTAVVALALHLVFLLSSPAPRQVRVTPLVPEHELDVRLQEETSPAPGAPGGSSSDPDADAEEPVPVAVAPRRPVAVKAKPALAKPVPHEVVSSDRADADPAPAPVVQSQPAQPTPIPSNSRDPNWRRMQMGMGMGRGDGNGSGSGRGGLFGNGHVVGDGPGALEVRVCFIPPTTRFVAQIRQCDAIYQLFLDEINVPARRFEDGFPGFEDRTEWFALMIQGMFTVPESGLYQFRLKADDGAQLFIDGELVVDNDGIHGAISKRGRVELREGRHRILLRYFQGMKYELALQLFVTPPGQAERLFRSAL